MSQCLKACCAILDQSEGEGGRSVSAIACRKRISRAPPESCTCTTDSRPLWRWSGGACLYGWGLCPQGAGGALPRPSGNICKGGVVTLCRVEGTYAHPAVRPHILEHGGLIVPVLERLGVRLVHVDRDDRLVPDDSPHVTGACRTFKVVPPKPA